MKHTKTIIIASVATLILMAGIVVSCNKESNNQETTSTNATSQQKTRGGDPWQLLNQKMFDFWQYCDYAYCSDTGAFMTACRDDNYTQFYRLTSIPESLENSIDSLMQIVIRNYDQQHNSGSGMPGTVIDPSASIAPCSQCASAPLLRVGMVVKEIRDFLVANNIHNPSSFLRPIDEMKEWIDNCTLGCNTGDYQMCWRACFLTYYFYHAETHYNAPDPGLE